MKRFFFLLMLVLGLSASAQSKSSAKAVIRTKIHCDHCQACETCGKNFQEHLLKIDGIRMYELGADAITVYYNPKKINVEAIRKAISGLGYEADGIQPDPAAYAKLDDCCKPQG